MKDKIQIGQMDATENFDTFSRYGLRYTPSMILFKNGAVLWQYAGAMAKADLKARIESALS